MKFDERLNKIIDRHSEINNQLIDPGISSDQRTRLSKEYAELSPIIEAANNLRKVREEMSDLSYLITDKDTEKEFRDLAEQEFATLKQGEPELERQVQVLLLPGDQDDAKNVIIEVRAGTGGDEAALFAADLFRMYQRYSEMHSWRFEVLHFSETGLGGVKDASASISGRGVFARLKFESGVHRVQRVPKTEASGRVHTSAATVAVLPEAEEVDIHIDDKDLRIDVFRASGPGGQSVNTTDSAVRITHVPTGIVVSQQDEKSQHKNKAKGMRIMRARLYEQKRAAQAEERAEARRLQVGTGDRSERVRTYNFPQGRITDHRINVSEFDMDKMLRGELLDPFIDALARNDQVIRLDELG
jgi:peptide chain release factor 1